MADIRCGCCEPGCAVCSGDADLGRVSPAGRLLARAWGDPDTCAHLRSRPGIEYTLGRYRARVRCVDCRAILRDDPHEFGRVGGGESSSLE